MPSTITLTITLLLTLSCQVVLVLAETPTTVAPTTAPTNVPPTTTTKKPADPSSNTTNTTTTTALPTGPVVVTPPITVVNITFPVTFNYTVQPGAKVTTKVKTTSVTTIESAGGVSTVTIDTSSYTVSATDYERSSFQSVVKDIKTDSNNLTVVTINSTTVNVTKDFNDSFATVSYGEHYTASTNETYDPTKFDEETEVYQNYTVSKAEVLGITYVAANSTTQYWNATTNPAKTQTSKESSVQFSNFSLLVTTVPTTPPGFKRAANSGNCASFCSSPESACVSASVSADSIDAGDWIWFSSIIVGPARDRSLYTFVNQTLEIPFYNVILSVPDAFVRFALDNTRTETSFSENRWVSQAPATCSGTRFASGVAFQAPSAASNDLEAKWCGVWDSSDEISPKNWFWRATTYSTLTTDYSLLDVSATSDSNCSPPQIAKAGEPKAYTRRQQGCIRNNCCIGNTCPTGMNSNSKPIRASCVCPISV